MMDDIAIELNDVFKTYKINDAKLLSYLIKQKKSSRSEVLHDVNLTVKKGEVIGLVGRNGCGKTTLMKIIAGMLAPTTGTVTVNGKMACIIESGALFINDEDAYNNVVYRAMMYGMSREEARAKADDIIRYAELQSVADKPVRTYSLGMRSRLGFSIMIHVDADIYILDEALNAGDSLFSGKAIKFINQLSMAGKTVILTSHSGIILREVCTRVLLIEGGSIIADALYPEINARYRRTLLTSVKTIEEAAESDNPHLEYVLAKVKQSSDPQEYESLLKDAAEGRDRDAMVEYGDLMLDKGDREGAMRFYDAAARGGNEEAKVRYAMIRSGASIKSEELQGIIQKYADNGDQFDEYRLGMIAKTMAIGTSARCAAYKVLEKAYENGNPDAGYEIVMMKLVGNGTSLDLEGGIGILSDNAERGHLKSAKKLYELYSDGSYMNPDVCEAFKWCEKAAKMGDSKSQFALATMYRDGVGTEKDQSKADEWLGVYLHSVAAPILMDYVQHLQFSGIDSPKDEKVLVETAAKGYHQNAASKMLTEKLAGKREDGLLEDCRRYCTTGKNYGLLAKCHLEGLDSDCDEKEAFKLCSIAANAGDSDSMYVLAKMYRYGIGTEKDMAQSDKWVRSASRNGQPDAKAIIKERDGFVRARMKKASKRVKDLKESMKDST